MGTNAVPRALSSQGNTAEIQPASVGGEEQLDAKAALEAMKQSTRTLNSATTRLKSERDGDDSTGIDGGFVDAREQQQEQGPPSNNGDAPVGVDMTESSLESVGTYFQVQWAKCVRALLRFALQRAHINTVDAIDHILKAASHGDPIRVRIPQDLLGEAKANAAHSVVLLHGHEVHGASQAQKAGFAARTKNMTFCFLKPGGKRASSMGRSSKTILTSDVSLPAGEQLLSSLPFDHFVARLQQELRSRDHLLPLKNADALIQHVLQHLDTQYTATRDAIRSKFPDDAKLQSDNNQPVALQWQQENPVAQVHVTEGEHKFEWGLLVVLQTRPLLRVHAPTEAAGPQETQQGPLITALAQLTLFLPKSKYMDAGKDDSDLDAASSAVLTSTYVCFAKHVAGGNTQEASVRDRARRSAETGTPEAASLYAQETQALPELVTIYIKGTPMVDDDKDPGLSAERGDDFVRVTVDSPFPRTRIVQAACSRFHTLLLSDVGVVFALGQPVDGALGLGDASIASTIVKAPRLITFFFDNLISVSCVACGGDPMAGAHSAAVSTDGRVFTWSVGIALGNGSIQSHSEPQLIRFPEPHVPMVNGEELPQSSENETRSYVPPKIVFVVCGGGFCVAVSDAGHAFVWGKWSDGRLGLGRVPILNQSSRKFGRRRQFQSFQLTPKQLVPPPRYPPSSSMAQSLFLKVSHGDAHCVALMRDGAMLSWGRGNHGQLGHGNTHDSLAPVAIAVAKEPHFAWRDVAIGENWSMALDSMVACGRGTAVVAETILQQHHRLLKQASTKSEVAPPPLPQLSWMRPQLVPSFDNGGVEIQQISAGLQHAAAVPKNGDLYQWGEQKGWSSLPTLVPPKSVKHDGNTLPAFGSSTMGAEIAERVVCGGSQAVVFTSGTFLARSLQQLHRRRELLSLDHQELDQNAFKEVTSQLATDIALLVSGRRLFAHQFLLARRSRVLREVILDEQRIQFASSFTGPGSDNEQSTVMELLLPQLRYDVAKILLEFMYTDNFSAKLDPQSYLVRDVLRAAQTFELPILETICRDILDGSSAFGAGIEPLAIKEMEIPTAGEDARKAHMLNHDLDFALGDAAFSDTTIIAEDHGIAVHRSRRARAKKVIHVDEPYFGVLRVLKFIYNDHVTVLHSKDGNAEPNDDPSDTSEQLIDDLIAADKYGLARWKRLCEHSTHVSVANCLDVLAIADLVSAVHLKQVCLEFAQANLHEVTSQGPAFQRFKDAFPHLLEELYTSIRLASMNESLLRRWHNAVETQLHEIREQDERAWALKTATTKFPWLYLIMSATFATLYLAAMRARMDEYVFVPAINLVAIIVVVAVAAFFGSE